MPTFGSGFGATGGPGTPAGTPGSSFGSGGPLGLSPGAGTGIPSLVNKIISAPIVGLATGSFAIPTTSPGNLLVVMVTMTLGSTQHPTLMITDDATDIFSQPAWDTLPDTDATTGQMYRYSGGTAALNFYGDCWYAASNGGATTLSWSLTNAGSASAVTIEFFVYELTGLTSWGLLNFGAVGVSNSPLNVTNYPYEGPVLVSDLDHVAYFTTCNIAYEFFPNSNLGALVNPSTWTLDGLDSANAAAYLIDDGGSQQAEFTRDGGTFQINNLQIGVVFGPGGAGGGGIFQPNVCINT